ncbi:MAG: cysteine--tRNA ligase [Planctomycetota bacterium]
MSLHLYNTLTRKREPFTPLKPGRVSIYTCGPTIYGPPQIGNLRAFVFYDILVRTLETSGLQVDHVMNVTDVDDKTIRTSREKGMSLKAFTEEIAEDFFRQLKALRCRPASHYPRATESIPEMVSLIETLREKGHTYEMGGSTYFRVESFSGYGKLSGFDIKELKAGARVDADEYEKEGASDFALWKGWQEEDGEVYWETALGKGRPGWHIECSAMALKHLGETLDIHGGGSDLIFPHHENEIAQSEAATGKPFVRYWLHNGWLLSEGKKMSKSLKNYYVLSDIEARGYTGVDLRYFFLTNQYRQQFNFTWKGMAGAAAALARIRDFFTRLSEAEGEADLPQVEASVAKALGHYREAMDDDLNTAEALGAVHSLMTEVNRLGGAESLSRSDAARVRTALLDMDRVLALLPQEGEAIPEEIQALARERLEARTRGDYTRADALRDQIKALGYVLEDTPKGPRLKKA